MNVVQLLVSVAELKERQVSSLAKGSHDMKVWGCVVQFDIFSSRSLRYSCFLPEYYDKFLFKLKKKTQHGVTGLLLVYPKSIIHLLEVCRHSVG